MPEASGLNQLLQRMQGVLVEAGHARGLVGHDQRLLAHGVLRGDARGAGACVAALGLNAAQRHHEAAPRIAPIGTQGHHAGNVEGRDDLACRTDLDALAQVHAQQRVVHQQQAFLQRYAHMVDKLHRRSARAALGTVDDDEVGRDIGFQHGLDHGKPFPRVTDAELETRGLAA
ncbi:hypothetical protein SDC9_206272 [bioreactor metagenome]|uniref:Uncharacterized protein n=1 Tax=bioreactor metagenome TaxID=1076179 RepID=A0A645J4D2_9ZZZZ